MPEPDQPNFPNMPTGGGVPGSCVGDAALAGDAFAGDTARAGDALAGDADHVGDLGAPSFWILVVLFLPICGVAFVPAVGLFLLGLSITPPEGSIDFHIISLSIQIIVGLIAMVVPHELLHGLAARFFGQVPWSLVPGPWRRSRRTRRKSPGTGRSGTDPLLVEIADHQLRRLGDDHLVDGLVREIGLGEADNEPPHRAGTGTRHAVGRVAVPEDRSRALALWRSGAPALWRSGALVLWCSGALVLWRSGALVLWRSGALALALASTLLSGGALPWGCRAPGRHGGWSSSRRPDV